MWHVTDQLLKVTSPSEVSIVRKQLVSLLLGMSLFGSPPQYWTERRLRLSYYAAHFYNILISMSSEVSMQYKYAVQYAVQMHFLARILIVSLTNHKFITALGCISDKSAMKYWPCISLQDRNKFLLWHFAHRKNCLPRKSCSRGEGRPRRGGGEIRIRVRPSTRRDGVTLAQLVLCRIKVIRIR